MDIWISERYIFLPPISINFASLTNTWQFCNISGFSQETSKNKAKVLQFSCTYHFCHIDPHVQLTFAQTAVQKIVRTCTYIIILIYYAVHCTLTAALKFKQICIFYVVVLSCYKLTNIKICSWKRTSVL
jgi:hypothetical protein